MRKLVVYTLLSVDGVATSPERFVFDFDEEMYANLTRVIQAQDVVLLGRRTYEEWATHWPSSNHQPFAGFINRVQKYVASSAEPEISWTNSRVIGNSVPQFVRDLKRQVGADIGVHGSIQLARSLFESELVDELRLVIAPTVAGSGRRLFEGEISPRRLELVRSVSTPSGALLVDYQLPQHA